MIPNVPFPINPFPGLRPFEAADAQYFYGRDEAIDELLGRLEAVRAVALLGASGSGKSSLVRAGLLPDVSAGALGHSSRIAVFTPGWDPVGNRANNAAWAKSYDSPAAFDEVAAFVEHSSRVGKRNARLPWIIGILLVAALVWWWLWW